MKYKERKKELLKSGIFYNYCRVRRDYHEKEEYYEMNLPKSYSLSKEDYILCEQLRHNKTRQRARVRKRMYKWKSAKKNIYFITFHFNNTAISKKQRTRRKYILKILNEYAEDYMFCIDYGDHKREHYHSLVILKDESNVFVVNKTRRLKCQWLRNYYKKYGTYYAQKVINSKDDYRRVSAYLAKKKVNSLIWKNSNITYKRRNK